MANSIIVRTISSLDKASLAKVKDFAKKSYNVDSEIKQVIDESLIAGFTININGIEHDYSVSGMLDRMSQTI